jgi:hypothetical protein
MSIYACLSVLLVDDGIVLLPVSYVTLREGPESAHALAKSVVHVYELGMGEYWPIDNSTICQL